LIGIDVLYAEALPGLAEVLAPNEELLGVITEIVGENAKIETNEGIREYLSTNCLSRNPNTT
jgi:hypothetical protein